MKVTQEQNQDDDSEVEFEIFFKNSLSFGMLEHRKAQEDSRGSNIVEKFCLEKVSSGTNTTLRLKNNHNYFYQCQALLHICDSPWIDFVVRTLNPYDIFIQRIEKNTALWEKMVAKLTAFYELALLPEIASPRHKKYPGIREPGNWYADENNIKKKTPSLKKKEGKRKDLTTDDEEAQGPSNLNDHKKTIRRFILLFETRPFFLERQTLMVHFQHLDSIFIGILCVISKSAT
ncbi:unnamed protein product [Mytilus edulis]|uniref:Uncharacterized protein n=1 Tax=Mytilus edulis TaxID=6550 RepID=A0A8S3TMD2_MYTED|nr:unnamed protein product [Mytilus edulis]